MAHKMMLLFSITIMAAFQYTRGAVNYTVTNTAPSTQGGISFKNQVGVLYSRRILASATNFIWTILEQTTEADRKTVSQVSLFIDDMDPGLFTDDMDGVAYTSNDQIHVSARYIQGYSGDVKNEITGLLYHETTHVWQWNGNGQAPLGLIEGIADYVRLKAGFAPSHWVQPGQGDRWDQGYDVTARFLDYCNGLRNGFVAQLNKNMRTGYSNGYFVDLLGKPVDQLWNEYKASPSS